VHWECGGRKVRFTIREKESRLYLIQRLATLHFVWFRDYNNRCDRFAEFHEPSSPVQINVGIIDQDFDFTFVNLNHEGFCWSSFARIPTP
jgi:hypothetical protein